MKDKCDCCGEPAVDEDYAGGPAWCELCSRYASHDPFDDTYSCSLERWAHPVAPKMAPTTSTPRKETDVTN